MASIILGAAGRYVGGMFGGPIGEAIGGLVGTYVGSVIDARNAPTQYGPRLNDLKVMTSSYGGRIPIVYGTIRIAVNIIWSTPLRETIHTEEAKGGGDPPSPETKTFTYDLSCAALICEGEIGGVSRIWMNNEIVYDVTPFASPEQLAANGRLAATVRVYTGTTTQPQDPTIVAEEGATTTPAYRGIAYVVFDSLQLERFGNHMPNIEVEVAQSVSAVPPAVTQVADTNVGNGYFPFGAFGNVGTARTSVDEQRRRIWCGATTTTNKDRLAYLDMATLTPGYITLQIPAPTYVQNAIYIPEVDSLIVMSKANGLGTSEMYEISPDTGIIKSQATWIGLGNPLLLYYDSRERQVFGVGSQFGSVQLFRMARIAYDIAGGLDIFGHTIGDVVVWVTNSSGEGNITADIFTGTLPTFDQFADLSFDGRWMYLGLSTGEIYQLEPERAFTTGAVFFDGWSVTIDVPTYGKPRALLNLASQRGLLVNCFDGVNVTKVVALDTLDGSIATSVTLPNASVGGMYGSCTCLVLDSANYCFYADNSPPRYVADLSEVVPSFPFTTYNHYGVANYNGILISTDENVQWNVLPNPLQLTGDGIPVSDIVVDLAGRVGVDPSALDVTDIAGYAVLGYVLGTQNTARSAINPLSIAFQFDGVESDSTLKFIRRNKSFAVQIPEQDYVITLSSNGPSDAITMDRQQETELPWTYSVTYMDIAADYQLSIQYARRLIGQAVNVVNLQVPMTLSAEQAGAIADNLMFETWAARTSLKVSLPKKYAAWEPTDVIRLFKGAAQFDARIVSASDTGYQLDFQCVQQDPRNAD